MGNSSSNRQWWGFAATALGGTILHFFYEWTGESLLSAPISAVNESTWEHMKLLFIPTVLFALLQRMFRREEKNFWCIKLKTVLLGLLLIPVLFYTYNGAFGKSPDWINITIFFVTAAIIYYYEYRQFQKETPCRPSPAVALLLLCVLAAIFVIFTFFPPQLPIFRDPTTGLYGIA